MLNASSVAAPIVVLSKLHPTGAASAGLGKPSCERVEFLGGVRRVVDHRRPVTGETPGRPLLLPDSAAFVNTAGSAATRAGFDPPGIGRPRARTNRRAGAAHDGLVTGRRKVANRAMRGSRDASFRTTGGSASVAGRGSVDEAGGRFDPRGESNAGSARPRRAASPPGVPGDRPARGEDVPE